MTGIKLSEKHGMNPSMQVCFFCGKSKGVALFGKMKGDAEAPRKVLTDYEPCEECQKKFRRGILLVGVADKSPDGRPPITEATQEVPVPGSARTVEKRVCMYPTGRYVIATEDFLREFLDGDRLEGILSARRAVIDDSVLVELMKEKEQAE